MLEEKAGLSTDLEHDDVDCVQLHGSLDKLRCNYCSRTSSWSGYEAQIQAGDSIPCPYCAAISDSRKAAGKRGTSIGILVPDIVRTGQNHIFGDRIAELANLDQGACPDVFLILGTSLKAYGAHLLAKQFARATRASGGAVIFVNIEHPRTDMHGLIDFWEPYDCDAWVREIMEALEPPRRGSSSNILEQLWRPRKLHPDANADKAGSSVWNPIVLD